MGFLAQKKSKNERLQEANQMVSYALILALRQLGGTLKVTQADLDGMKDQKPPDFKIEGNYVLISVGENRTPWYKKRIHITG